MKHMHRYIGATRRQTLDAYYARLTWSSDIRGLVLDSLRHCVQEQESSLYTFSIPDPDAQYGYPLTLHVSSPFESSLDHEARKRETHGALHYSIADNGMIVVVIYPHSSASGSVNRPEYRIDELRSPYGLAGAAGRARVRRHVAKLLTLSEMSAIHHVPDRRSEKFLDRLGRRTDKYIKVHDDTRDRLRAAFGIEVALGTGLAAGMVSASISLLTQFGKEESQKAMNIAKTCNEAASRSRCLDAYHYILHANTASYLTTPAMLIGVWMIAAAVFLVLFRMKHSS